jgi:hypothetical protein
MHKRHGSVPGELAFEPGSEPQQPRKRRSIELPAAAAMAAVAPPAQAPQPHPHPAGAAPARPTEQAPSTSTCPFSSPLHSSSSSSSSTSPRRPAAGACRFAAVAPAAAPPPPSPRPAAAAAALWSLRRPQLAHCPKLTRRQLRAAGGPFSRAELARHRYVDDCWVAVDGAVYDVTEHVAHHPGWEHGGISTVISILAHAGSECGAEFRQIHAPYPQAARQLRAFYIGELGE